MADGRFDNLLMGVASKHKNVEELNYSILSFFERRTDLFHIMETSSDRMGFGPGVAEKMVMKHFRHCQEKYFARCQPHLLYQPDEEAAPAGDSGGTGECDDQAAVAASTSLSSSAAAPAIRPTAASQAPSGGYPGASSSSTAEASKGTKEPDAEPALPESTRKMMRHISTWNGAVTDNYHWSQSIAEVILEIQVEAGSTSKDIKADISSTRLSLRCKGNIIIEGKLYEKVLSDDAIWYLEDNKIVLTIEKQRQTWWKCVLEGDEEIDTTKVESTRTMDEYDGETQGAIRKIMFDQSQKASGKPTSDQIRTADMMRDAWNSPGSPFRGTEFDPSLLNLSGPVGDEFFQEVEERKIAEARGQMEKDKATGANGSV